MSTGAQSLSLENWEKAGTIVKHSCVLSPACEGRDGPGTLQGCQHGSKQLLMNTDPPHRRRLKFWAKGPAGEGTDRGSCDCFPSFHSLLCDSPLQLHRRKPSFTTVVQLFSVFFLHHFAEPPPPTHEALCAPCIAIHPGTKSPPGALL